MRVQPGESRSAGSARATCGRDLAATPVHHPAAKLATVAAPITSRAERRTIKGLSENCDRGRKTTNRQGGTRSVPAGGLYRFKEYRKSGGTATRNRINA